MSPSKYKKWYNTEVEEKIENILGEVEKDMEMELFEGEHQGAMPMPMFESRKGSLAATGGFFSNTTSERSD